MGAGLAGQTPALPLARSQAHSTEVFTDVRPGCAGPAIWATRIDPPLSRGLRYRKSSRVRTEHHGPGHKGADGPFPDVFFRYPCLRLDLVARGRAVSAPPSKSRSSSRTGLARLAWCMENADLGAVLRLSEAVGECATITGDNLAAQLHLIPSLSSRCGGSDVMRRQIPSSTGF